MASRSSCRKVLIGPVAGRPICEAKPTPLAYRPHGRTDCCCDLRVVQPSSGILADLQTCLKRRRLSSLSHMLSFLFASQLSEEDHSAFVKAIWGTTLRDFCQIGRYELTRLKRNIKT